MEVKINVDESQFKDILEKELKDLPKEIIQDVIVKSIQGYFEQNSYENVQKLFLYKRKGYNSWDTKITSTEFLNGLLKGCDYSGLQEIVDEAIKTVKENHMSVLCNLISDIVAHGLCADHHFRYELENAIQDVLCRMKNN